MKYVIIEKLMMGKYAILFPDWIDHSDFKDLNPISAGFVTQDMEENEFGDRKFKGYPRGESKTLNLKSDPDDEVYITSALERNF